MASTCRRRSQYDSTLIQCLEGTWEVIQRGLLWLHRTRKGPRRTKETLNEERQSGWISGCFWNLCIVRRYRFEWSYKSLNLCPWTSMITCWCMYQNGKSWNLRTMEGYSSTSTKDLFEDKVTSFRVQDTQYELHPRTRTETDLWMGLVSPWWQQFRIQQSELVRTKSCTTSSTTSSFSRW